MITRADIQATCDDIVREFAPLQVIRSELKLPRNQPERQA